MNHLYLISAPPASGKTTWISLLGNELGFREIILISPLRAHADECLCRWPQGLLVMTPEEWLGKKLRRQIVIFDEFHLFFYWGDTFRERMWECFYELSLESGLVFLLTATVSQEMLTVLPHFASEFEAIYYLDFGNRQLKHVPFRYVKVPSRSWLVSFIEREPKGGAAKLIFCRYREEVFALEKRLRELGYSCISCVGGESRFMQARLLSMPAPDFIISTTVLSHGVNLPKIQKVIFLYETQNLDFWIQMVARGGRRGERFEVFSLEKPLGLSSWSPLKNFFYVQFLSFRAQLFPRSWSLLES